MPWRRFWLLAAGTGAGIAAALFLFVALVDPWDAFPLSPGLPRLPVSSQSRYALPMLARSPRFDSAVIGTSTSRLLRPAALDPAFGARFVNLAFNSATASEQVAMLGAFLQAHPAPLFVLIGLDVRWCDPGPEPMTVAEYRFPAWLYEASRWAGYREAFTLFGIREAWAQAGAMLGLKPVRQGLDGYTNFAMPEQQYDLDHARRNLVRDGVVRGPDDPAAPPATWPAVTLPRLARAVAAIPPPTRVVLFFVPFALSHQGTPDSAPHRYWAECKRRVAGIARARPDTVLADLMFASPLTADPNHYYDAIHYRTTVADRVANDLAAAAHGAPSGDVRLLVP